MKKFDTALDVDEVLAPCLEQDCQVLGIDPQRITDWNLGKPLRNTELNAALYLGRQKRVAGKQAAIGYFAAALVLRSGTDELGL